MPILSAARPLDMQVLRSRNRILRESGIPKSYDQLPPAAIGIEGRELTGRVESLGRAFDLAISTDNPITMVESVGVLFGRNAVIEKAQLVWLQGWCGRLDYSDRRSINRLSDALKRGLEQLETAYWEATCDTVHARAGYLSEAAGARGRWHESFPTRDHFVSGFERGKWQCREHLSGPLGALDVAISNHQPARALKELASRVVRVQAHPREIRNFDNSDIRLVHLMLVADATIDAAREVAALPEHQDLSAGLERALEIESRFHRYDAVCEMFGLASAQELEANGNGHSRSISKDSLVG